MAASLALLAAAHGVATTYDDWSVRAVEVDDEAVILALAAMDVDASTEVSVQAALCEATDAPWRRMLPPATVVRGGQPLVVRSVSEPRVTVDLERGGSATVTVEPVAGERHGDKTAWSVELPDFEPGWHKVHASADGGTQSAVLVVAPPRLELPADLSRAWGWMLQLYSLRSAESWGIGDYGDLRTVVDRAAADGAGALLLNPLHAETPRLPINPSPYSPSSRRLRALVYLRLHDVPEYATASAKLRAAVDELRPQSDPDRIGRDAPWTAKLAALELLWPHARREAVEVFRAERGAALEEYALFCSLTGEYDGPWQQWPVTVRHPSADGIAAARRNLSDRIAFWCWTQLLVDEQLAGLGQAMPVGLIHDLAVGVDAGGADAWALQDALALSTTVGAPPDSFNQQGQDWGLPPWRPDRLRELAYAPFRDLVRGVLRHAGGLRIDHVMGLFRLWWVPAGATASEGTYVSYDSDALLGILALEASRAGAVVIGEDLGTVEARVRRDLDRTGILGSAVLWFETEDDGAFIAPGAWPRDALATVTTHDL
ncbi:MAG: 4-alpha-glucanotransferase, partial [Mycobacteriales bacterium]